MKKLFIAAAVVVFGLVACDTPSPATSNPGDSTSINSSADSVSNTTTDTSSSTPMTQPTQQPTRDSAR